jgi:large subunit ribosomal protein L25
MAELNLLVDAREVTGKKVRSLRRQGIVPAHLYGRGTESLALQASTPTITTLLRTAGANAIINLKINGDSDSRPVMLRGVQRHPVTDELIHVDFFQISLTEKLRADVPLNLSGVAPAVHVFGGVLLQSMDHITIEALPTEIPSAIDVDVSGLETLEAAVHVRDLPIPAGVTLLTDPDQVVAKVGTPRVAEEEAPAAAAEEGAVEGAPAEGAAEGAAPAAEGEKKEED